jgi:hypothetical protein
MIRGRNELMVCGVLEKLGRRLMHKFVLLTALSGLAACAQERQADPAIENDAIAANVANAGDVANMGTPAALASLNETSWEFTDPKSGKAMQESIDAGGNYITVAGKEHIDHGTATVKDGKACFTSAMTKEGEECWADPALAIGQSGETTSDKGKKLTIKRTAYTPLTM